MRPPPPPIQRITFVLLFLAVLVMLGLVLLPFWTQLFLAFLLASVFYPAYNRLCTTLRPWLAACLTCLLITLCVFLPLLFCIGAISAEIPGVMQLAKENDIPVLLQQSLRDNSLVASNRRPSFRFRLPNGTRPPPWPAHRSGHQGRGVHL